MNSEQAIKVLNGDFSGVEWQDGQSCSDVFQEAFEMAIKALENESGCCSFCNIDREVK